MDAWEWAKLVAGSSVVASITTGLIGSVGRRRDKERSARSTALTAALSLETYAAACRTMMYEAIAGAAEAARQASYDPVEGIDLPKFVFPDGMEWKTVDHATEVDLREFEGWTKAVRRKMADDTQHGDPLEYVAEVEYRCTTVGLRALELARETRRREKVPARRQTEENANLEAELQQQRKLLDERREEQAQRNLQIMRFIESTGRFPSDSDWQNLGPKEPTPHTHT